MNSIKIVILGSLLLIIAAELLIQLNQLKISQKRVDDIKKYFKKNMGCWIKISNREGQVNEFKCSNCGVILQGLSDDMIKKHNPYCRYCGSANFYITNIGGADEKNR